MSATLSPSCAEMFRSCRGALEAIVAIIFAALWIPTNAWSAPSKELQQTVHKKCELSEYCDRRDLLKGIVATSIGTTVVGTTATSIHVANAASFSSSATKARNTSSSKVYEPPPASLNGKVIVITGGTTGLGLESAKRLAAAGATIVLTARTKSKGERAVGAVLEYLADRSIENSKVYVLTLNLDDLESVRSFPQRYSALPLGTSEKLENSAVPIDVLMHNAGVAAIPQREVTKDGLERTFQTNHLGPFVLTSLLFPCLSRQDGGCRVIIVSSYAHEFATLTNNKRGLDLDNLNGEIDYSGMGWPAYCRSKLENVLFAQELQRRADAAGLDWLTVVALHPGRVATDIWRTTYFGIDQRGGAAGSSGVSPSPDSKTSILQSFVSDLFYDSILTVKEGANTQVMLAARGEQVGSPVRGQYYDWNMRVKKRLNAFAKDKDAARRLWEISEQLARIEFRVE